MSKILQLLLTLFDPYHDVGISYLSIQVIIGLHSSKYFKQVLNTSLKQVLLDFKLSNVSFKKLYRLQKAALQGTVSGEIFKRVFFFITYLV